MALFLLTLIGAVRIPSVAKACVRLTFEAPDRQIPAEDGTACTSSSSALHKHLCGAGRVCRIADVRAASLVIHRWCVESTAVFNCFEKFVAIWHGVFSVKPLFVAVSVFSVVLVLPMRSSPSAQPPNVVVILADDQGWGDLGFNGNRMVSTPRIDALSKTGVVLGHFYVSPVCAPTRAEFLTGRYHTRVGVRGVQNGNERLNLDERTIADVFKDAGYSTGLFGKWHNGGQGPYHPNARGFSEFYGYTQGHWPSYFDAQVEHNGRRVRSSGYLPDDVTKHACDFIEANRGQPFLCYLALPTPHSPMQVPDRYWGRFAGREITQRGTPPAGQVEDPDFTRAVLAMTENIDDNVGRVLDRLDALNLTGSTIVVYFSDNGPNSWRWNAGMKGRKASVDEGGVRSPCIIRWPGHVPVDARLDGIAGVIDLFPTLADMAGIALHSKKPLDGVSLRACIERGAPAPDRLLFAENNGKVSVRSAEHRIDPGGALFDITKDPQQTTDISKENPAVAARLKQAVEDWKREVTSPAPRSRPYPVGYCALPRSEVPAGEGIPSGGILRSARWPNSSYFTHWTSARDSITWPIEVLTAGRYRIEVYYACPAADVGAMIEATVGQARILARLEVANDPPLLGAANDRVKREESYTKDFRPFRMGEMDLPAGTCDLTLRAIEIPGSQAMEVQAVAMTLLP